jgi:SAM-dependent methyltransferase
LKLKQIASFLAVLFVLSSATVWSQEPIPFVPTTMPVVERMLELAGVRKGDLIYDLGCGDGRILIHAAKKYSTRGVGVDLDPQRIAEAKQKATEEGVSHLLEFRAEDGTQTDISKATESRSTCSNGSTTRFAPSYRNSNRDPVSWLMIMTSTTGSLRGS